MCRRMPIRMHMYMCMCMHMRMRMYMHMCMHMHMRMCMHMHMHMYVCALSGRVSTTLHTPQVSRFQDIMIRFVRADG